MKAFVFFLLGFAVANGDKIVGGTATNGPIPYQVRMEYGSGGLRCGGSLIHEDWVLSAAHCKGGPVEWPLFKIYLGYYDSSLKPTVQERRIAEQLPHPAYDASTLNNDIMLLKLSESAVITEGVVDVVQLPAYTTSVYIPTVDTECTISGWGKIWDGGMISATLQEANVSLQSNADCNGVTKYNGLISNGMMCLWDSGKDSCNGDSGGPAVCNNKLYGVVSWGAECGHYYLPGVYTRVAYYMDWIESVTGVSSS